MQFLHQREYLNTGDVVVVNCSHRCNIRLTDDYNFRGFKSGGRHSYYGGHFTHFPARIAVPSTGYWNITIDLGGGSATIQHSISIIKAA
jgi:hypothetical protein